MAGVFVSPFLRTFSYTALVCTAFSTSTTQAVQTQAMAKSAKNRIFSIEGSAANNNSNVNVYNLNTIGATEMLMRNGDDFAHSGDDFAHS